MSPRWRKVAADLWSNRTRTVLVVLSIAVGVFAVGMVEGSGIIMTKDLRASYQAASPSSGQIYTRDSFDEDLVNTIRHMRGVQDAEGRRTVSARYNVGPGQWREIQLIALRDYKKIRVAKVQPKLGAWPPPNKEVLLERSSVAAVGAKVGDWLLVEGPDGKRHQMRVAGVVLDLSQIATLFRGLSYGYISMDTLEWVGETRDFNQLNFAVSEQPNDKAHVEAIAAQIRTKIENSGREVAFTMIFNPPGKHWADDSLQAMGIILGVLGALSMVLSGFLVVNTITSLLAQQIRQVGIMKAVGARADQVIGMYLTTVAVFSALALGVAVPLGVIGARAVAGFTGTLLNFEIGGYSLPPSVLWLQIGAGVLVPLVAAFFPVVGGTRISVRQAISSYGLGEEGTARNRFEALLGRVRGLSRPALLSLRNTVRRKGRLALTLTTLSLAGAIFIGILSVQRSLLSLEDTLFQYWNYDVEIAFNRDYRIDRIDHEASRVPGVARTESWVFRTTRRIRSNDTESVSVYLVALPAATKMLQPILLQGRWLVPADENALVVNTDFLKEEPDLRVGQDIVLKIGTRKYPWRIVGLVQGVLAGPLIYANYPYASQVIHKIGRADRVQIVTARHDGAYTSAVSKALEAHFRALGLRMSSNSTTAVAREQVASQFNVIIVFLMIMAVLLAVVGALGLMGTMSINVLERTREIGVMRAIGASDWGVVQIVLVEGVLIGVASWLLGAVLSIPLGWGLNRAVGQSFLYTVPTYRISFMGMGLWLGIVIVLAAIASFLPAYNASKLTVRDVLAYE